MGGCYSCKSTEPNTHYCTFPMASESKLNKRTTPYFRNVAPGSNSNQNHAPASSFGFGFKRKHPIIQTPSLSGERTGNLVQKYEKITLKNDTITDAPSNANASRFGFRPTNINKRVPKDANSNSNIPTDNHHGTAGQVEKINNNVSTSQKNAVGMSKSTGELTTAHKTAENHDLNHQKRTEMLKKQFLGSDFTPKNQVPDTLPKNQTSQKIALPNANRVSGNQNSIVDKSNRNLNMGSTTAAVSKTKPVGRVFTALPRPSQTKCHGGVGRKAGEGFITITYKAPSRLTSLNANVKPKLQRFVLIFLVFLRKPGLHYKFGFAF